MTGTTPAAYRTAAMMRANVARKTLIDSPFRGATDTPRLLWTLAAALTMALSAPAAALGAVELGPPAITGTAGDNGWLTSDVSVKWAPSGETSTSGCETQLLTADTPGTAITCTASAGPGEVIATRSPCTSTARRRPRCSQPPRGRPTSPVLHRAAADQLVGNRRHLRHRRLHRTDLQRARGPGRRADWHLPRPGGERERAAAVHLHLRHAPSACSGRRHRNRSAHDDAATAREPAGSATTTAKAKAKRPTLTWRARPKVKYYNLQLFRNGRKILSAWPTVAHYTLKPSWRYHGHTYKLAAGRYRWYVWPGYGPRSAHRYGRLVTKGVVTVPQP